MIRMLFTMFLVVVVTFILVTGAVAFLGGMLILGVVWILAKAVVWILSKAVAWGISRQHF